MDRQVPLNVFPNTAMKVIPLVGAELYYDAHFLSPEEATILFNILFNKCPWVRRKGMYGRPRAPR